MPRLRVYHEPKDDGGSLIRPHRITTVGAYESDQETRILARATVRRFVPESDLFMVFEMLGIDDEQAQEESP